MYLENPDFAPPGFGIKAKPTEGKAARRAYFAPPGFGIKAKQHDPVLARPFYFAPPGFGIKAKLPPFGGPR